MKLTHIKLNQLTKNKSNKKIKYTFSFVSLITPHKLTNLRLMNINHSFKLTKKYKKLFVKQSYLLMT